jgi:hypothetical protein
LYQKKQTPKTKKNRLKKNRKQKKIIYKVRRKTNE